MRRGNPRVTEGLPSESSDRRRQCLRLEEQRAGISRTYAGSDIVLSRLLLSSYQRLIPGLYLFGGMGEKPHKRKRLRDLVQDVEQHMQANGPWQYKLSRLYDTPEVTAAVERRAAETRLKIAA